MKLLKVLFTFALLFAFAGCAFGNATDDLFDAAQNSQTTPEQINKLIKLGANVNAKMKMARLLLWVLFFITTMKL